MGKLIRLELFNFKSYKGHHTLLFGDSFFTSIIGPNGSGKSNSMDAISFVLGIKSSHLRSSHLRDLVYRGRVLRTSTINGDGSATDHAVNGQPNGVGHDDSDVNGSQISQSERHDPKSAWVMAVYEDDAGDELQWKRTITSQGVSEYRINNRVVSAQAYNEALEGENILIKARNFLVFQGDVEAIASQSPKDLTRLIEQISGSLEYRAEYERLKEAMEQALENQGYNLNRRRGINSEIKQYQEQKREADNYARKADERDQAIVDHVLWKLYHLQQAMEDSNAEIKRHQEELKEQRRGIENYEKALDDARKEESKARRDVDKTERNIKSKEREIQDKENSLVPVETQISMTKSNLETCNARFPDATRERDTQSSTLNKLKKDLNTVDKAREKWESDRQRVAQQEGRVLSEQDIQEYNKIKEQVSTRTSADQAKLDGLTRQRKTEEETLDSLKGALDSFQWQIDSVEAEVKDGEERRGTLKEELKKRSSDMESKKKELKVLTSERLRASQKQTELEEKLQEVLKTLFEADDGRRQSEKETRLRETISMLKSIYPGVRGRISELCKPKMKKYNDAVSTVLGRHFDSVVVDTEKTAKECIQLLRDQRAAQATFIPLDTIQVKAINSNLKGMHQGMRIAVDTIEYDSSIERALYYACGNSIVCDDLSVAKHICYDRGVEARAVTLDGTVIHKGGLMTGGRGPGRQNAERWEDSKVDTLRKLQDKLMSELQALPKGNRRGVAEETIQGELGGLEQRLKYIKTELKSLDLNVDSKKKELDFAKRQLKEIEPKYNERSKSLENLKSKMTKLRSGISSVEDSMFNAFCERTGYANIREYEAQQGSRQQEAAQKKLEFTTQKSRLENQISLVSQRLQSSQERFARLEASSQGHQKQIKQFEAEKKKVANELDVLNAQLEQLEQELSARKDKLTQRSEKVAEQRGHMQKRNKESDGSVRAISGNEAEMQRQAAGRYALLRRCKLEEIKLPLARGSASLDDIPVDELLQNETEPMDLDEEGDKSTAPAAAVHDYGIDINFSKLNDDLKMNNEEKFEEELEGRITNLTGELEKISPNMRAIERLEGVEGRLKHTEKDFDDARRHAKDVRDEFNTVREKRLTLFNKAFSHISEQIGSVYKDLTRSASFPLGGQAYLDMEDSDEPYLDGIKYHAMPPLKRFRDMEHLSGGEKTMAALALLFAVHSFQPSPFFVLDEVDAALDNTNVSKIANYIREHAGPGMQFIVISLKNTLFQASEALVGIYRDQSANSSKALTLDLRKYQ